jgi:hypothetical protein
MGNTNSGVIGRLLVVACARVIKRSFTAVNTQLNADNTFIYTIYKHIDYKKHGKLQNSENN